MKVVKLLAIGVGLVVGQVDGNERKVMPTAKDSGQMWWAGGFPIIVEGAPWVRTFETGYFGMSLNTRTLQISDFSAGGEKEDLKLDLGLEVNGKKFRAVEGGEWTRFTGPRLIEAGRFLQRMDVTDVVFRADDGATLNTEARLEVAVWPDRLGLILDARPGMEPIRPGEKSFGKSGGGFGLDGSNDFVISHREDPMPAEFLLEFWAYVPSDYQATRHSPWLVCKGRNEAANGNVGVMIVNGKAVAKMNVDGPFQLESKPLKLDTWNLFTLKYLNGVMTFLVNDSQVGEKKIGRPRKALGGDLVFGRRGDSHGEGYRFRGVVDEIVISGFETGEIRPGGRWRFRADGRAAKGPGREKWVGPKATISLQGAKGTLLAGNEGGRVGLPIDPVAFKKAGDSSPVTVEAEGCEVTFDPSIGWHRINMDRLKPVGEGNDAMDRVRLSLSNPGDSEEKARLMFEKTSRGFRGRLGSAITGVSVVLRDQEGNPSGIPVQHSKNWHAHESGGEYSGQWFHGISQLNIPPGATLDLELVMVNGHWGGVAAASHAQLSLIGWGGNSLWHQSALGCWGESICYDPDQAQANATITDVRPLMITGMNGRPKWSWTSNMGGGDFFRFYDLKCDRVPHQAVRDTSYKTGPCLTGVSYEGGIVDGLEFSTTVSLGRTDDLVRGTYRIRMEVTKPVEFSRLALFQLGSDTYNYTRERKFAIGTGDGLVREWEASWGGNRYQSEAFEMKGDMPWVSLHDGDASITKGGVIANRGMVIRSWNAQIAGENVRPWVAERGITRHRKDSSIIDLLLPPGVRKLQAGDFVEATIEHLIIPKASDDYYGPNEQLREALVRDANTWKMVHREARGNRREIDVSVGNLERRFPDVRVKAVNGSAELVLTGGLGYVPVTVTGLASPGGSVLIFDGKPLDQSVHGKDFWQTNYDEASGTWSRTYNVPIKDGEPHEIKLLPESS